ncbi:M48 family metallopeptidase [Rhodoferax sp. PAMC 29310]|uniref:M48 family metallopeptidase n=1 Tax=Rhodoferax sp. PAMC 29310 TaxID=2822760 RepID=UPI001B331A2D|nr:SprT family zinc-dependent metalloprotease [Rhodoferax sp. PAMC 29310]
MHPLLRFTLDLFDSNQPLAPVRSAQSAINFVVDKAVEPSVVVAPKPAPLVEVIQFTHPRANRETRLGGQRVGYEFKRGQRRTIGFSVSAEGLVVRAPKWVTLAQVEAALQEKSTWIVRKLDETRARHAQVQSQRMEWRRGAKLPLLGASVALVLDPERRLRAGSELQSVSSADVDAVPSQQLVIPLPLSATAEQVQAAVQLWLMRHARALFVERLNHFAPQLQVQWGKLALSNAATRWGSAKSDGSIRLNWRLIHFDISVIDYVVVHELSHLRVMDHSPRFWATVASVMPDYDQRRRLLKAEPAPRGA